MRRGGQSLNALKNKNDDGKLLTIPQVAESSNLGTRTVRRIAEESGALRKIGRCVRVDQEKFFDFIEQNYSE